MITEYENSLRSLIIKVIGEKDTAPYKIAEDRIAKWEEKREIELKKNKGILSENRILYYSDFYDLKTIIHKNWELFAQILQDKKRFEIFFNEIERFRNSVAHGRNLTLSQENLLNGITSDLKNLITVFHNKNEMKDDFFIQIIRVSDNLGNIWDGELGGRPQPTLRVDDDYELTIDANDPKSRKISYEISLFGSNKFRMKQDTNRFNFCIPNIMVGKNTFLIASASTPDSEYENNEIMQVTLTVLPK